MNSEDKDLIAFFKALRDKEDQEVDIPVFEELITPKRVSNLRPIFKIGIAASILIVVAVLTLLSENSTKENDQLENEDELVIFIGKEADTNALISDEFSILSWDSPTEDLINDFND